MRATTNPGLFPAASQDKRCFGYSVKDKLRMSAECRSGSLNDTQRAFLLKKLKESINDVMHEHNMQNEFQCKLVMFSPDPNIFLQILAGWRSSEVKAVAVTALDKCIRIFYTLYPEIYEEINQQSPIYRPS